MNNTGNTRKYFSEIALALSFIVGAFSLFSVAFGVQRGHVFNLIQKPAPSANTIETTAYTNTSKQTNSVSQGEQQNSPTIISFAPEINNDEVEVKYILQNLEKLGAIKARSFLVGDLDTGEIIFERKPHTQYPIASVTKYMTAFTAAENLEPNEITTITRQKLKVEGNRGRFKIGDRLSVRTLLYPLLLVSSNDAGEVLAYQRNYNWFIQKMNELAKKHKLLNTSFQDPTGLSRNNVSTARDLFKMMRVVRNNYPQIVNISKLNLIQTNGYTWRNINKAANFPEFKGGKTGYTNAARQTSIGYYQIKLANDQTKNIGVIILQSNTRTQDTRNILNYLKKYVAYL